jgi:uncharacterized lipoprotein YajG
MRKISGRTTAMPSKVLTAIKLACFPAALLFAGCNQPPPPATNTTVIERPRVIERPAVTIDVNADEQRRRDAEHRDDQHRPDQH